MLKKSVVIVSTGRTGTKYLSEHIARALPDADVYHNSRYGTIINLLSNAILQGFLPKFVAKWFWLLFKKSELQKCDSVYVDSNNHLYAFLGLYKELYPNLLVVHVVRSPFTYVKSHLNWALGRKKSWLANFLIPFWQPNGYFLGDFSFLNWCRLTQVQRFAWIWKFKNSFISESFSRQENYYLVKFEDLFSGDELVRCQTMNSLGGFLGVDKFDKYSEIERKVNFSAVKSNKSTLLEEKIFDDISKICEFEMIKFGYTE